MPEQDEPGAWHPRPKGMENLSQYIGVTLILGILVWGMIGFYRGLSMPGNEHRLDRSGDTWLS